MLHRGGGHKRTKNCQIIEGGQQSTKKCNVLFEWPLNPKLYHLPEFKLSIEAHLEETVHEDVKAIVELKNLDKRIQSTDGLVREIILPSGNLFQTLDYTFTST